MSESETMKDYEEELDASFKKVEEGDILEGTVVSVDDQEVVLDLKYYAEGIIPADSYSSEPGFNLKERVQPGDEVSAMVVKTDDGNGNILLSRIKAMDVLAWDRLKKYKDEGTVLDVVVKGVVNKGVVAYVEDVRGFIPASKLALNYVDNTESYLNQHVQVQIIDLDRDRKKLVLSARDVLRKKEREERKNRINNVQIGLVTEGVVETLQPYGAFVNLGNGLSGLVHVSQISDRRVKDPSDVLAVGDKVKVKIIGLKEGKISLSMRQAMDSAPEEMNERPSSYNIPGSKEEATTPLKSLFANIKLDS